MRRIRYYHIKELCWKAVQLFISTTITITIIITILIPHLLINETSPNQPLSATTTNANSAVSIY